VKRVAGVPATLRGLQQLGNHLVEFGLVERKVTNALSQFIHCHRILVVLPQELRFSHLRRTRFHFASPGEFRLQRTFSFRQLFQQGRGDGQTVATSQLNDFAYVTEAGTHHHRFIAVLLVVFIDFRHGNHARIFMRRVLFLVGIRFVPVQNTTNER